MVWKPQEGCEELVLVQPSPWQAPMLVAGCACGGAVSKAKLSAASRGCGDSMLVPKTKCRWEHV